MAIKLAVMQPYFFPYLGYFQLIDKVDHFVLYGDVTFRKKSFITRNYIVDTNGKQEDIKAFVNKASSFSKIIAIDLVNDDWKIKLTKKIRNVYSNAPFFSEVYEFIETLIINPECNLHRYNAQLITRLCELFNIDTYLSYDNEDINYIETELDAKNTIPVATQRVLKLCKHFNATAYYNPVGGMELYKQSIFTEHGVTLSFFQAELGKTTQLRKYPSASVIDTLMHYGISKTTNLVKNGTFLD